MVSSFCRSDLVIRRSPLGPDRGPGGSADIDLVGQTAVGTEIGRVVFLTHKKEPAEAILDGRGTWRCPGLPVLDRVLNTLHAPRRNAGDDVPFGSAELIRVAGWLKGVARFDGCTPARR